MPPGNRPWRACCRETARGKHLKEWMSTSPHCKAQGTALRAERTHYPSAGKSTQRVHTRPSRTTHLQHNGAGKHTKTLAGQCHQPNTLGRAQHQVTTQVKHRVSKTAPPASNQVEPQQGHHCITEWLRSPNPAGRSECKMHGAPMRESNASANQQAGKRQRPAGAAKMASKNTCMVHNEPFLSIVTQSNATNSS
jgi:hypothetical protein